MILVKSKAFTIIELLIVITLLGILSVVTISTLNANKQRSKALDSVKLSNMEKIKIAADAYFNTSETGVYPASSTDEGFEELIAWPDNSPAGSTYVYVRPEDSPTSYYAYTESSEDHGAILKYSSNWGSFKTCYSEEDRKNIDSCATTENGSSPTPTMTGTPTPTPTATPTPTPTPTTSTPTPTATPTPTPTPTTSTPTPTPTPTFIVPTPTVTYTPKPTPTIIIIPPATCDYDNKCDFGENYTSCPCDCPCPLGLKCVPVICPGTF